MKNAYREFFRKKAIPFLIGYTIRGTLYLLASTCRFRIEGKEKLLNTATTSKCILIAWHNRLGIIPEILKRCAPQYHYAAMISNSRDGEIISVIANSYRHGHAIRVPHNKRAEALQTMITRLKRGGEIIVVTPDGPRGPRYKLKQGSAMAARECSASVIPLSWTADRFWTFRTWDGLMLPKPFSKITVKWGDPIALSKKSISSLDQDAQRLESALLSIDEPLT
jgi:lysophospholipid acyltransferase (LPLAT)-like uncharacterized protein